MDELWDLYDKEKNKINKVVKRGDKLNDDEFHLVVNAWIKNSNDEFLITRRSPNKPHPLMWECTGGSALFGEDSLDAAVREVKEELGIDVLKKNAKYIGSTLRYYPNCNDILDVWLFESNVKKEDIHIQEEEVVDVMWASRDKLRELFDNKEFEANIYFKEIINNEI